MSKEKCSNSNLVWTFPTQPHTKPCKVSLGLSKKKKKKSRNFTIMNNNYILRGKNIKAVQIAMIDHHTTSYDPWVYCVLVLYIYIHVYIKYMPKFQLIYIISHMRWKNSTCTHKKIKRTLKFMKVINKYIYLIFSLHKAYYLHDQKMADEVQTQ